MLDWKCYTLGHEIFNVTHNDMLNSCACDSYESLYEILNRFSYWFCPYVPSFVDGATVDAKAFDTKEELVEYVKKLFNNNNNNNQILCMNKNGYIIEVKDSGDYWWVIGYTNLEVGTFPDWNKFTSGKKFKVKRNY